ncbi:MAG: MATE family efflux transporter [Candidatus Ornithospirochaeta sp.]
MTGERKDTVFSSIMTLALPIIAEEILSTLLQYVDTAMVGRLGAEATASVNLTSTVNWLIGCLFSAIGVAVVALISSSIGAGDKDKVRASSASGLIMTLAAGVIVGMTAVAVAPFLPSWMNARKEIQRSAGEYFFIISLAIPFRALSIVEANALRATKDTRTPMAVNLAQNALNIVLNYLLIYTFALGVRGAAIATLVSYSLGGITMTFAAFGRRELRFRRKDMEKLPMIVKEALSIALPAAATSTTSCLGHIVFASLVSGMGTITFAAHSIALSAEQIFYVPGYGLRGATSTLIGISVGENDRKKFRRIETMSVAITMVMMAFTGLLLFLFARPIMAIFTPVEEVRDMGAEVLKLIAFSEPIFGLMIVSEGICYGLGDTKFPFFMETIGAWGIRILFTVIGLKVFHISLFGVWICMLLDNSFRALSMAIPIFTGRDMKLFLRRREKMERNQA